MEQREQKEGDLVSFGIGAAVGGCVGTFVGGLDGDTVGDAVCFVGVGVCAIVGWDG